MSTNIYQRSRHARQSVKSGFEASFPLTAKNLNVEASKHELGELLLWVFPERTSRTNAVTYDKMYLYLL